LSTKRAELVSVRDVVVKYFHARASLDDVRDASIQAGRSLREGGMTMEDILVVLRSAVTLASEHVSRASTAERAVALRSQMTPWLISIYMNESGEFDEPADD
jgi:hypothetical protein